ncbi:MAG: DUF1707 domain-containing protein [Propionicimonas sp.]|nr:DUF1707 domain-containing protein [Propionicimonas sp.]
MTSSPSEPTDVGPAVGGDLAATDLDREHVVLLLNEATNEGLLPATERDRRVGIARTAETFDDLVPLTRDLVTVDGPQVRPAPLVVPTTARVDPAGGTEEAEQIVAIFSGASRAGHWRVRKNTSIATVFGGAELDTTEAVFEAKTVTMNVFCMFGGVELRVPDGVEVRNQVSGIFGGVDVKVSQPQPGAPTVVVRGVAMFGGVEIRNPKAKRRGRS